MSVMGAHAATTTIPVTGPFPYTISTPGDYQLAGNINVNDRDCIRIRTSNVRLYLRGYTIRNTDRDRSDAGITVGPGTGAVPLTNICIAGPGTVRHFNDGVRVQQNVRNLLVTRLTLTDNTDGVCATSSGLVGHTYSYNTATANRDNGFELWGEGHHLCRNIATGNLGNGIQGRTLHNSDFVCNRADGGGVQDNGISVHGNGNLFYANSCVGNGDNGIELRGDDNGLSKNTTSQNLCDGIELERGSERNLIWQNVAYANGCHDFHDENLDAILPLCLNSWSINLFGTDNENDGPGAGCIQ